MGKSPFSPFGNRPPMPPAVAVDRFGKMIEQGHLVLFHSEEDLVFEVVSVTPVLNPGVPDGQRAMQVMLAVQFPVQFLAAMPNRGLVICGETQARVAAKAAGNGKPSDPVELPSGLVLTDRPEAAVPGPDGDDGSTDVEDETQG